MSRALAQLRALGALRARRVRRSVAGVVRAEPLSCALVAGLAALGVAEVADSGVARERPLLVAAVAVAGVALAHGARGDERLLRLAGAPHRGLFAAEYTLLLLPVALLLAAAGGGAVAALPLVGAVGVGVLPSGGLRARLARGARRSRRLPVPRTAFEWIAGVRRALPAAVVYAVALVAAVAGHLAGVLVLALLALAWVTAAFYFDGSEGWPLVAVFGLEPRAFLRRKVRTALVLYGAAALPVVLLFAARHPGLWRVLAAATAGAALVMAGAVALKYALYEPGRRRPVAGAFGIAALTLGVLAPPVGLFLLYRFWMQAEANVATYLDAAD